MHVFKKGLCVCKNTHVLTNKTHIIRLCQSTKVKSIPCASKIYSRPKYLNNHDSIDLTWAVLMFFTYLWHCWKIINVSRSRLLIKGTKSWSSDDVIFGSDFLLRSNVPLFNYFYLFGCGVSDDGLKIPIFIVLILASTWAHEHMSTIKHN